MYDSVKKITYHQLKSVPCYRRNSILNNEQRSAVEKIFVDTQCMYWKGLKQQFKNNDKIRRNFDCEVKKLLKKASKKKAERIVEIGETLSWLEVDLQDCLQRYTTPSYL